MSDEAFNARIEHLSQQLQGAQAHALHETQLRQETKMAYRNPHGFYEELREVRLTIQGLRKFMEEAKHWKVEYNEKVEDLKQE